MPGVPREPQSILGGNLQANRQGQIIRANMPDVSLATKRGLLECLERMANGDLHAEMPSCNLILTPPFLHRYPNLSSAEDHALVARLLANGTLSVIPDLLVSVYRLAGQGTSCAKAKGRHRDARAEILREISGIHS